MADEILVALGIYLWAMAVLGGLTYYFWHEAERGAPRMIELTEVVKGGDLDRVTTKVQDLENRLGEKEKTLAACSMEIRELRLRQDVLMSQMAQIQSRLKEAEASATREAQQAKELTEILTTKVRNLENQAKEEHELLEIREAELRDLKAKIQVLVSKMTRMESMLRGAEALVLSDASRGAETGVRHSSAGSQGKGEEPNRPAFQAAESVAEKLSANVSEEIISPQFFDRMILALIEATGPIASLVVRDQIAALGESPQAFPKKRVGELVEIVNHRIMDPAMRARFWQQMTEEIRESLETKVTGTELQIKQKQTSLPPKESSIKRIHDNLSAKIHSLENRLRERDTLLKICEKELRHLMSKIVARLKADGEEVEPRYVEQNFLIQAREEMNELKEQMSAEMARLKAELKEKKILLAEMERNEWRAKGVRGFYSVEEREGLAVGLSKTVR